MADIILRRQIVSDDWSLIRFPVKDEPVRKQAGKVVVFKLTGESSATPEEVAQLEIPNYKNKSIIPLAAWLQRKEELIPRLSHGTLGVWIDSYESPDELVQSVADINSFPIIAVNFPRFNDGRGFSIGYALRKRYGYQGELRAIGDILRDQLFYMSRCGFDAFVVRPDKNIQDALCGLNDFSESYQPGLDQPLPLFRRRQHVVSQS